MRKFYLSFYLALLPVISSAQDRIEYNYDASGNRVKREIVMPVPKAMAFYKDISKSYKRGFENMYFWAKRDGQVFFRGLHDSGSTNSDEESRG